MREFPRGVLFSDLDGTFLDEAYVPALDAEALRALQAEWRLIWVSSRTADELYWLHARLSHRDDAIGENGGVLLSYDEERAALFGSATPLGEAWVVTLAAPVASTRARVREALAAAGARATDVSALDPTTLATLSGYGIDDARRALARRASVLLTDLSATAEPALAALRAAGLTVVHGGRWTSIVDGADKGRTIEQWRARCAPGLVAAGVGDAANDATLLSAVDHPFVIRNPKSGHSPVLLAVPGARALTRPGTAGWAELVTLLPALLPESP